MAKRLIVVLFTGLLGVFMMSHNANAVEASYSVQYVGRLPITSVKCAVMGGNFTTVNGNTCVWGKNVGGNLEGSGLSFISTQNIATLPMTHIYEVYITVGLTNEAQLNLPLMWSLPENANFYLLSFEKVNNDNNIGSSATNEAYVSTYRFLIKPRATFSNFPLEIGFVNRDKNMLYLAGDPWTGAIDTRIEFINDYLILTPQDNSTIVNAINQLKQSQEAQNDKEEQATENIENQSPSDMQVGSDSSAQSLIGTLSSFLSYITNLQATNCNVSLPFPSYAGGTITVNVCQGKDKAGNIVSIFSSLTLFVFYMPVAFKLLSIIYSEVRSFTNG